MRIKNLRLVFSTGLNIDNLFYRLNIDNLFYRLNIDNLFYRLNIDSLFYRLNIDSLLNILRTLRVSICIHLCNGRFRDNLRLNWTLVVDFGLRIPFTEHIQFYLSIDVEIKEHSSIRT